jgi:hypothetical protein
MNTKAKLFTGAVALALSASAVLTASNASARPYDYDYQYSGDHNRRVEEWKREHSDRYRNRRDDERSSDRYDNWRYPRRSTYIPDRYRVYPRSTIVRLPYGCRRVVHRDRTYYTRDNDTYYSYDPVRRGYVVVNLGGLNIGF